MRDTKSVGVCGTVWELRMCDSVGVCGTVECVWMDNIGLEYMGLCKTVPS